jgi:hypothetical protein
MLCGVFASPTLNSSFGSFDGRQLTKKTPGRRCSIKASGNAVMDDRKGTFDEMNLQHFTLISMIVKTGKVTI